MDLSRRLRQARGEDAYTEALRQVLGTPGSRAVDGLSMLWAHQIAWTANRTDGDELQQLGRGAMLYGVSLDAVLDERTKQLGAPPTRPAPRRPRPS